MTTNLERIRQMTADELAEYICDNSSCDTCKFFDMNSCTDKILQWLEQESEE